MNSSDAHEPLAPDHAPRPEPLPFGTHVAGRYEIERTTGTCARGFLYAARDTSDGRVVTLEVVASPHAADPAIAAELQTRAARTAQLAGEGIARPLAAGVDAALGAFWIAHEPFEGESLRARLGRGRVTPREAVRLAAQILDALAPAHAAGEVHRGLEPEDIVLVRGMDGREEMRILDFGLSRALAAEVESPYVSPEQARSSAWLTPAADTYSVAAIFYELVAGQPPGSPRTPLAELVPGTPPAVSALVEKGLSVDPGARPMGASEMRTALDRALTPTPAPQPAPPFGVTTTASAQTSSTMGPNGLPLSHFAPIVNDSALRAGPVAQPPKSVSRAWVVVLVVSLLTCLLVPVGVFAVAALLGSFAQPLLPTPDPQGFDGPPAGSGPFEPPTPLGEAPPPGKPQLPGSADGEPVYTVPDRPGAPSLGSASAPVTIQLFSDFQCPFCVRLKPTLEAVLAAYPGRVRVVWRNYPLPFHADARPAAEAALEAQAQGGDSLFWQMHEKLFENPRALDRASLERHAQELGLDVARFRQALDDHRHAAAIDADIAAADATGLSMGTPTCFVNGRAIQGAQPLDAFRAAIDRALAP
jgi:protein-disulfide isomerase/serine/threonine protein kinase